MPSALEYALLVEKEHKWLPRLAPFLPLKIPEPLAKGEPSEHYPWSWSIYRWLEGESCLHGKISDLCEVARDLAHFLLALQQIDPTGGPLPGPHSFYRGGSLSAYDQQTCQAIDLLKHAVDARMAARIWEIALLAHGKSLRYGSMEISARVIYWCIMGS